MSDTIEQLDELHAATTQGECIGGGHGYGAFVVAMEGKTIDFGFGMDSEAKFTAAIHNAWPEISKELKRLQAWKREAIEVICKWSKCHEAAGSPAKLGEVESEATEREIVRMRDENEQLRDALQELLDFSGNLQGTHFARSMHARIDAGALLNPEAANENQRHD